MGSFFQIYVALFALSFIFASACHDGELPAFVLFCFLFFSLFCFVFFFVVSFALAFFFLHFYFMFIITYFIEFLLVIAIACFCALTSTSCMKNYFVIIITFVLGF